MESLHTTQAEEVIYQTSAKTRSDPTHAMTRPESSRTREASKRLSVRLSPELSSVDFYRVAQK